MIVALALREVRLFPAIDGKPCVVRPHPGGFELRCGAEMVAGDVDPKWLTKCAHLSGALEVKWDWDFRGWD